MKFIKFYGALTLLSCIAYFSVSFMETEIEPDLKGFATVPEIELLEKGEILPKGEWLDNLMGRWQIDFTLENPTQIVDVTGIVTFNLDSTFVDDLEYKYYENSLPYDVKREGYNLKEMGKSQRYGKFKTWVFKGEKQIYREVDSKKSSDKLKCYTNKLHKRVGYDFDFCRSVLYLLPYIGDVYFDYGDRWEVMEFTHENIVIRVVNNEFEKPFLITYKKIENFNDKMEGS